MTGAYFVGYWDNGTISSYDTTINSDEDYGDLYEEDVTIFDNVTLASSNEPFAFDWGLFYTGMSNKDYQGRRFDRNYMNKSVITAYVFLFLHFSKVYYSSLLGSGFINHQPNHHC